LVTKRLHDARARLEALQQAEPGREFTVLGETFIKPKSSAARFARFIRVAWDQQGRRRNLTQDEHRAFWAWAAVEFLRHTGVRIEETNNYYQFRDGDIADLLTGSLTAGELFQRYVPGARTVKTFNTIYFEHLISLARPAGSRDRSALPIAGDDDAAKESVTALLDRLGYDTVDAGATTESWRIQEGSPAYVLPYLSDPRLPWPRDPGKPADAKEVRTALEQARSRS
jgi:hypothetical protein